MRLGSWYRDTARERGKMREGEREREREREGERERKRGGKMACLVLERNNCPNICLVCEPNW